MKRLVSWLAVSVLLSAVSAGAAARKPTVGIFLPATLTEGQERFAFGEALAAELSRTLRKPVVARSFGRSEDFAKAVSDGQLDWAVVDAWTSTEVSARAQPVALASLAGETGQRWAVVAPTKGLVKDFAGKRLAVIKGAGGVQTRFVSNAVFGGDLDAAKHFKLVTVPNIESALAILEAKGVEAALVPANHVPKDLRVIYRSSRLPSAVLLSLKGNPSELRGALAESAAVAPFDRFVMVKDTELAEFDRVVQRGPAARVPLMMDSPTFRVRPAALLKLGELGVVTPDFTADMDVPAEQPDP